MKTPAGSPGPGPAFTLCWTGGSTEARERGNELRRVDRAPAAGQVVAGPGVEAGDAGEGVITGGDVHDPGAADVLAQRAHEIEPGVEQAEPVMGHLVGERDDAGEDRRRLAGAAEDVPGGAGLDERVVNPRAAVDRGAHRDVRRTALLADLLGDEALVDRAREDSGHAAAAGPESVVPHDVRRQPVAAVVQVEHGAADRGDQRVG